MSNAGSVELCQPVSRWDDAFAEHPVHAELLVFGRDAVTPFEAEAVRKRAVKAFADAEIDAIGLHECRHTFASLMIAAGVNAKALSTYMGHSSITITLDRYGHLMPGNEDEAAGLLDEYLERSTGAQTGAQSS
jgi:integrase